MAESSPSDETKCSEEENDIDAVRVGKNAFSIILQSNGSQKKTKSRLRASEIRKSSGKKQKPAVLQAAMDLSLRQQRVVRKGRNAICYEEKDDISSSSPSSPDLGTQRKASRASAANLNRTKTADIIADPAVSPQKLVEDLRAEARRNREDLAKSNAGRAVHPFFGKKSTPTAVTAPDTGMTAGRGLRLSQLVPLPPCHVSQLDSAAAGLEYQLSFRKLPGSCWDLEGPENAPSFGKVPSCVRKWSPGGKVQRKHPAGSEDDMLWTEKYKPATSADIIGNATAVGALKSWLASWRDRILDKNTKVVESADSDSCSGDETALDCTAMIIGPVGCGKTTAVYAVAKELGFHVIEINSSDRRSGEWIKHKFGEAMASQRLCRWSKPEEQGDVAANNSPDEVSHISNSLILIEEVDADLEEDSGFCAALSLLADSRKRPVIFTSNNPSPNLPPTLLQNKIYFHRPLLPEAMAAASIISANETLSLNPQTLHHLTLLCSLDLRHLINYLQLWGCRADSPPASWKLLEKDDSSFGGLVGEAVSRSSSMADVEASHRGMAVFGDVEDSCYLTERIARLASGQETLESLFGDEGAMDSVEARSRLPVVLDCSGSELAESFWLNLKKSRGRLQNLSCREDMEASLHDLTAVETVSCHLSDADICCGVGGESEEDLSQRIGASLSILSFGNCALEWAVSKGEIEQRMSEFNCLFLEHHKMGACNLNCVEFGRPSMGQTRFCVEGEQRLFSNRDSRRKFEESIRLQDGMNNSIEFIALMVKLDEVNVMNKGNSGRRKRYEPPTELLRMLRDNMECKDILKRLSFKGESLSCGHSIF